MVSVLRCGTLFDATGGPPRRDVGIVVDGGRIAAVGAFEDVYTPAEAEVVDLSDAFVLPGLVDAHSHISIDPGKGDQSGQMRAPVARRALWATDYFATRPARRYYHLTCYGRRRLS